MNNKGFFICITGIDGAGKTTLAKGIVELLNEKGVECKYVYARFDPFLLKPLILIGEHLFLRKSDIFEDYSRYSNMKKDAIKKHNLLSKIYRQILLFDYFLQIFFKIKMPLLLGKNIICDRYIYDTVVTDISVDMSYSKDKVISLINKLFYIFPKPNIIFLIDLSEEIAFIRKNDIPSIGYLRDRRNTYLTIGKKFNMSILDGSENMNRLKDTVQERIFEELVTR